VKAPEQKQEEGQDAEPRYSAPAAVIYNVAPEDSFMRRIP